MNTTTTATPTMNLNSYETIVIAGKSPIFCEDPMFFGQSAHWHEDGKYNTGRIVAVQKDAPGWPRGRFEIAKIDGSSVSLSGTDLRITWE